MSEWRGFRTRVSLFLVSSFLIGCELGENPAGIAAGQDHQSTAFSQTAVEDRIKQKRKETWSIKATNGSILREDVMRATLDTLVREVALALNDPSIRTEVYSALHNSPYREHKVRLATFLSSRAPRLQERLASRGLSKVAVTALLGRIRDMEMYLPQPEHFAAWEGGDNLIVVASLREHDEVFGYTLQAARFIVPENQVPNTPSLAIVNTETAFDDLLLASECAPEVFYCDGDPTGGGQIPPAGPGVYLTHMSLNDLHEGFPRGEPEIEVCLIGRGASQDMVQAGQCANEGGTEGGSATGLRVFDQNTATWSTSTYGVLVASQAELEAIAGHEGVPVDSAAWLLQVWEDDTDRGVIRDEDMEYELVRATVHAIHGFGLWLGLNPSYSDHGECTPSLGWNRPWYCSILGAARIWAALNMALLAPYYTLTAAWAIVTGANDDFVGVIVDADQAFLEAGITSSHPFVLMRGSVKAGEATLTFVR